MTPQAQLALTRLLSWVPSGTEGENFRKLVTALVDEIGELLQLIVNITESFDPETAVGDQLDKIGALVRLPRSGFSDAEYRRNLFCQIEVIKSYLQERDPATFAAESDYGDPGSVNKIIQIIRLFITDATPGNINYLLIPPYSFKLSIPGTFTVEEYQQIFNFIRLSIYSGVLGYVIFVAEGTNKWATATSEAGFFSVISVNEAENVFNDLTSNFLEDDGSADFIPFLSEYAIDAYCAFGFDEQFTSIYFNHRPPSTDGGVSLEIDWQYWDGGSWKTLPDINDGTNNMTSSDLDQEVSWVLPEDWATTTINGVTKYWVRAYLNNVNVLEDDPTYISGAFAGDPITPPGIWDAGAVVDEAHWSTAIGSATQVWSVDGVTFTDLTTEFNDAPPTDIDFFVSGNNVDAYCAFGFDYPYQGILFSVIGGVQGVGGLLEWEYWKEGGSWEPLPDLVDGTVNFTSIDPVQILSYTLPEDWAPTSLNGESPDKYYLRALITQVYVTPPEYTQGALNWPEPMGVWDEGAVPNEGVWSGVLSTAGDGVNSNSNTNT